jgi:hypothetical protein
MRLTKNRIDTLNRIPVRPRRSTFYKKIWARRQIAMTSLTSFVFAGIRGMPLLWGGNYDDRYAF